MEARGAVAARAAVVGEAVGGEACVRVRYATAWRFLRRPAHCTLRGSPTACGCRARPPDDLSPAGCHRSSPRCLLALLCVLVCGSHPSVGPVSARDGRCVRPRPRRDDPRAATTTYGAYRPTRPGGGARRARGRDKFSSVKVEITHLRCYVRVYLGGPTYVYGSCRKDPQVHDAFAFHISSAISTRNSHTGARDVKSAQHDAS